MSPIAEAIDYSALPHLKAVAQQQNNWSYFGKLYYDTTESINKQLAGLDNTTVELTLRFQYKFAEYFLTNCSSSNWHSYAAGSSLHPLQYYLLGLNAHINGDMWQALIDCFNEDELELYQHTLLKFQSAITNVYNHYYSVSLSRNIRFRTLHLFTLGLSKKIGCYYIYKCRSLQVKLALLYFRDQDKFNQQLRTVNRRKKIIDDCILKLLN